MERKVMGIILREKTSLLRGRMCLYIAVEIGDKMVAIMRNLFWNEINKEGRQVTDTNHRLSKASGSKVHDMEATNF